MRRAWGILALAVLAAGSRAEAQYFGQNQVQYDKLDWKILETEHFLVHYYPSERTAVMDAARMAERSYARLSRMLNHQFREKKPLILYASRSDFGQNNVTGDLGETTGGVTEALRHRILLNFTGDYKSFEHVLAHEIVHAFQYDIFARGRAGNGLETLAAVAPPLWFAEGMAEYLSLGPGHVLTQTWVRDAALNGTLPTIDQMTERPDKYFPYRYGEALWEYVGQKWGDEVIGEIMNAVPNVGIERAFARELGISLDELSEEWREAMQAKHLPVVAENDRPRKFSEPLLSQRKTGSFVPVFIAPSFSPDGKHIAYVGYGSLLRGEVFTDLWLADGQTGKRLKRLVKTNENPDAEELRQLYSQSAFSPDGKLLAYTAMRRGKDVLFLVDVKRRSVVRSFSLPLEQVTNPSFSPDGKQLVFTGNVGGLTDLYVVDANGKNFRRLTNDKYGDLQPQWSPDGKSIVFTSDRGAETDFNLLRFADWQITTLDLETRRIEVIPGQGGLNINPNWSPDGRSVAYVSDRTGTPNIFLYDLDKKEHFQLTDVVGGVLAYTEYSPVITWARQADRLAYVYYENGDYNVWSINNPRAMAREPFRPEPAVVATKPGAAAPAGTPAAAPAAQPPVQPPAVAAVPGVRADTGRPPAGTPAQTPAVALPARSDSAGRTLSLYRGASGFRTSAELPQGSAAPTAISVAQLLDSAALALPDTSSFRQYGYSIGFQPEYISRPTIGYAQDNFGRGVYGGTAIVLSDLLGNNRLAFALAINGRVSEAQVYAAYANLGGRIQYNTGFSQAPTFFLAGTAQEEVQPGIIVQTEAVARYIQRTAFLSTLYPRSRYTRFEVGASLNNVSRSIAYYGRGINYVAGFATDYFLDSIVDYSSLYYAAPFAAYVSDNTLFGYTGPISGRRFRFQVEQTMGSLRWIDYQFDWRRYFPLLFNWITLAARVQGSVAVGRDEMEFPKYIGRPDFLRGYDREELSNGQCDLGADRCNADQLMGSRVAFANVELRFPLIRQFTLGLLPIGLPPVDGLVFYDAGMAWRSGQDISWSRPLNYDEGSMRYPLKAWGFGIRLNLFGFALMRWDYAIPLDRGDSKGYWIWTLGQSF
jgi:hypothetical protein